MNILHINSEMSWRGGEQQLLYLVEELQKLKTRNFIICKNQSALAKQCMQKKLSYLKLPMHGEFDLYSAWKIRQFCRQNDISILHAHAAHAHSIAYLAYCLGNKVSIVVSRRVDYPIRWNFFSYLKYNSKAVRKIICVSHLTQKVLQSAIYQPSKLTTIHSGIDLQRFRKKQSSKKNKAVAVSTPTLRKQYKLAPKKICIANIAALSEQKDYRTFVKAARLVCQENKNVHFFIFGEGPKRAEIVRLIRNNNMQKYISLCGFRNDMEQILPQLDILLFTSQSEALGTSLLDAFAAGLAVVATNAGGIPEIVIHKQTGLLAPVGDSQTLAMHTISLIRSPTLRKKLERNALKKVIDFSKENTASKTYAIYKEVLKIA